MNSLELAYTVSILRRLSESSFNYMTDGTWLGDLDKDIRDATLLIQAYDKRLEQQAKKEMLYEV
jgi:hypothetical protein